MQKRQRTMFMSVGSILLMLLLGGLWSPAIAVITVPSTAQSPGGGGMDGLGTTITTGAFTSTPTAGSTIVCGAAWGSDPGTGPPVVTDTAGNTYSLVIDGNNTVANSYAAAIYHKTNAAVTAGMTVTATFNGGGSGSIRRLVCLELAGAATASLDTSDWDYQTGIGTGTDAMTLAGCCSLTPAQNSEAIVGFAYQAVNLGTATISPGTGFTTAVALDQANNPVHLEYKIQTTGSVTSATWTWDVTSSFIGLHAFFKAAGAGGGGGNPSPGSFGLTGVGR